MGGGLCLVIGYIFKYIGSYNIAVRRLAANSAHSTQQLLVTVFLASRMATAVLQCTPVAVRCLGSALGPKPNEYATIRNPHDSVSDSELYGGTTLALSNLYCSLLYMGSPMHAVASYSAHSSLIRTTMNRRSRQ